jgi:hypothetical protein
VTTLFSQTIFEFEGKNGVKTESVLDSSRLTAKTDRSGDGYPKVDRIAIMQFSLISREETAKFRVCSPLFPPPPLPAKNRRRRRAPSLVEVHPAVEQVNSTPRSPLINLAKPCLIATNRVGLMRMLLFKLAEPRC